MRRRCCRGANWCLIAISLGVGLLVVLFCPLWVLLTLAAIALIVLGALMC
ncbi:hypothetical protein EDD70_2460 [Hydrogenoanaerobacterium saccharovorans]|uniref:Uncharacterized protein n=1 Tax=Hydrogenoanaerobacterium saccharovorans TaxID=474960 RepID=A0A1H8D545_9FIRM|nr:hypothetical protein EDD70_2460 [Hydrogenoanaerobacterium saccharovorans]SEN02346.1 hypothetical protein SAMN05216180_2519 [Hydrogenoanaerobacterium saccharovorans]